MKKIISFFLVLFCISLLIVPVYGAEAGMPRLVDEADLLDDVEEEIILERLNEISANENTDVVVVTVDSMNGKTATEYADDFYDYNGYADDGILFLISMEYRDWAISTKGFGITAFTDAGLAYIEDDVISYLSEGDYYYAFMLFGDLCEDFLQQARIGTPYDVDNLPKAKPGIAVLFICFLVGAVIAFIVTAIMKAQLKSVRANDSAADYMKRDSMNIREKKDLFLYANVSKTARPKESSSGGGSSVHRSSSGSFHGGRSGKF